MRNTLVLFVVFFTVVKAFATHNIGGQITYKALGIYQYEITATVYTDARSIEADRPVITLDFGDGNTGTVTCVSQKLISKFINENIYTITHNYQNSGPGKYLISLTDANRTKDVVNADQSVSQMFYLESLLVIDLDKCANTSSSFTIPPLFIASLNGNVIQGLNIYDENGDSVVYELVSPLQNSETKVNGYQTPKGLKILNNQIIWQPENVSGKYLLALKIQEYRDGNLVGYVIKEWITDLINTSRPLSISSGCNQPDSIVCVYDSKDGKDISFKMKIPGLTQSNGSFEMFSPKIDYKNNPPVFNLTQDASGNMVGEFTWKPDTLDIRKQELNFVFRTIKNDEASIQNQRIIKVLVNTTGSSPCYTNVTSIEEHLEIENYNVYPNPFSQTATIKLNDNSPDVICSIFNLHGQKITEIHTGNESIFLDAHNLADGLYTYYISTPQKIIARGKFIVQK